MNFPNQISGTFNKAITLNTGTIRVFKNNVLFLTFTEADIVVVGNTFTIDVSNMFPDNADYYILMSAGLFSNGIDLSNAITDVTYWTFTIKNGSYANASYNNSNYLTV